MQETSRRLSVDEAAQYIGLARSTLNKYRGTGDGPRYLKIGRRVLYDAGQLDVWLAAHFRTSTANNITA
jgi:predicted DNA-binding transcriptional regulator AlpA